MSAAHAEGEWTRPGLSRLERVRAYRAEFGGDISAAVAAADAEIYRQERDGRLRLATAAPDLLEALNPLTSADDATAAHFATLDPDETVMINIPVRCILRADAAKRKATTAIEPNSVGTPQGVNQK